MRRQRFILLFFLLFPLGLEAFLVVHLNLEQLTALSEKIFVGRCSDIREGQDRNGRPVQYVSFQVEATLKGPETDRLTFKQLRLGTPEEREWFTATTSLSQLPQYRVGEEAVVFLSEPSDLGLTAPVGLAQGRFIVETDSHGKKWVKNDLGNRGLFRNLGSSPRVKSLTLSSRRKAQLRGQSRELRYEDLISWIEDLR